MYLSLLQCYRYFPAGLTAVRMPLAMWGDKTRRRFASWAPADGFASEATARGSSARGVTPFLLSSPPTNTYYLPRHVAG